MKTGFVCRKLKTVGGAKNAVVEEYEINTAPIESLNSVERRAAIETGQGVDRADISLNGKSNVRADLLAKAFTIQELEAMRARMVAVVEAEQRGRGVDAPIDPEAGQQPARDASEPPVKPGSAAPTATLRLSPAATGKPKPRRR